MFLAGTVFEIIYTNNILNLHLNINNVFRNQCAYGKDDCDYAKLKMILQSFCCKNNVEYDVFIKNAIGLTYEGLVGYAKELNRLINVIKFEYIDIKKIKNALNSSQLLGLVDNYLDEDFKILIDYIRKDLENYFNSFLTSSQL